MAYLRSFALQTGDPNQSAHHAWFETERMESAHSLLDRWWIGGDSNQPSGGGPRFSAECCVLNREPTGTQVANEDTELTRSDGA